MLLSNWIRLVVRIYRDFIQKNSVDQAKLFKATKTLLKEVVANDIGKFFAQKVHNIHANLNNTTVVDHSDDVIVSSLKVLFSDFQELSIDDVKNIIARSTKKSCLLRPMRTSIIMQCADELLPVITLMINLSLQSRFFAGQ